MTRGLSTTQQTKDLVSFYTLFWFMVISQKFIPYLLNRKAYFRYQIEILNHSLNTSIIYIALIAFEKSSCSCSCSEKPESRRPRYVVSALYTQESELALFWKVSPQFLLEKEASHWKKAMLASRFLLFFVILVACYPHPARLACLNPQPCLNFWFLLNHWLILAGLELTLIPFYSSAAPCS